MPAKRHRATLNEKEERVLAYIRDARSRPVDLAELARECFGEASGKSGTRATRGHATPCENSKLSTWWWVRDQAHTRFHPSARLGPRKTGSSA